MLSMRDKLFLSVIIESDSVAVCKIYTTVVKYRVFNLQCSILHCKCDHFLLNTPCTYFVNFLRYLIKLKSLTSLFPTPTFIPFIFIAGHFYTTLNFSSFIRNMFAGKTNKPIKIQANNFSKCGLLHKIMFCL